jgi:hypothetical protein
MQTTSVTIDYTNRLGEYAEINVDERGEMRIHNVNEGGGINVLFWWPGSFTYAWTDYLHPKRCVCVDEQFSLEPSLWEAVQ